MKTINIYFDESGSHDQSEILTVAGYWFEAQQARKFSIEWSKHLSNLGLSYAHMTDCAQGYGPYRQLTKLDCIRSEVLLIECIKRRSRFGFAVSVNPHSYKAAMHGVDGAPSAYTLCLMTLVNHIGRIMIERRLDCIINYIFESGHRSQAEANTYLSAISVHGPAWIKAVRYGSHSFCDKRDTLPLQAADMLAWQAGHYFKRRLNGHHEPRKDFVALVRKCDHYLEVEDGKLVALRARLRMG